MTVSKIRLNGTDHDIRAKYLIQSSSSDAVSAEFSARTVTEDAIANIQKIYGNTVVVSNNLVSNSATAIQSKDSGDNVIGGCDLNIPTLTGKLNGAGSSVVIFSDGIKKAGTVYDEMTGSRAIRRLIQYTFDGTESWGRVANGYYYLSTIQGLHDGTQKPLSNYYEGQAGSNGFPDNKCTKLLNGTFGLAVVDDAYQSLDLWKQHLATLNSSGSPLQVIIQLASPEEYILDNALQLQYPVVAGGTEMVLPTTGTAPMKMDVIYGNAADAAATMSQNFISVDSMKEFLAALGTRMNGTWVMQYSGGKYTFTFTSN